MEYGPPQIVRTVQKATCGDLKNFKRSGVVCEPLPVKRTAKKCKVSPASSISCWPLFSVPGMGDFTKEKRLFAGFRKISSEVQKSSCIVHRCTVYDFIAKKERRNGMLAGAAPVTFRVEKRTFRADGPTNRGKAVTLDP